jgi:hypothetical protein
MELSVRLHTPAALPPGGQPRYPVYRRLGGPQSQCGRYGEEQSLLPLLGIELGHPVRRVVTIQTELSRLRIVTKLWAEGLENLGSNPRRIGISLSLHSFLIGCAVH